MINKFILFSAMSLVTTLGTAEVCLFPGATAIPANSTFAVGPNVFNFASANPLILPAIYGGRDAWDVSDAINRIGNWNGIVTNSDCPMGQPSLIGAFSFDGSTCATNIAYGYNTSNSVLAYVDYFTDSCVGCGTKSLIINTDYSFSLDSTPSPQEIDLQGTLAHEFGHVLGLSHQYDGECSEETELPTCAANNNRETMGASIKFGETCLRDIESNDSESANALY